MSVFKGLVCIITGASSGIGRELAYTWASQGASLVLAARNEKRLTEIAKECKARGGQAHIVLTDVAEQEACKHLVEETIRTFGRLDILVNNAGISMYALFDELDDLSAMDKIMKINFYGSMYCTFYALPHLKASKGRIVGISSLTGKTGVPTRSVYAASKHAMAGFFDSLRLEMTDHGVSVTMIYPGFVQSEVRSRAIGTDGQSLGSSTAQEEKAMTAEACAQIISKATAHRKREVVMTARAKLGLWMKLIAPALVDFMAAKAIKTGK